MSEDPSDAGTAIKTSVSLPPYLHDWLNKVVRNKTFNSKSGAMVVALSELKGKLDYIESTKGDSNEKRMSMDDVYISIILKLTSNHPELREEINEIMGEQFVKYYGCKKEGKTVSFE